MHRQAGSRTGDFCGVHFEVQGIRCTPEQLQAHINLAIPLVCSAQEAVEDSKGHVYTAGVPTFPVR